MVFLIEGLTYLPKSFILILDWCLPLLKNFSLKCCRRYCGRKLQDPGWAPQPSAGWCHTFTDVQYRDAYKVGSNECWLRQFTPQHILQLIVTKTTRSWLAFWDQEYFTCMKPNSRWILSSIFGTLHMESYMQTC